MAGELDTAGAVDEFLKQPAPAQAARESFSLAVASDPDAEAKFRRLSQQSGVPVDSVRAFPNDVKNQVKLNSMDFDQMARDFPATTKFLANPDNATIAHDETSSLTSIEKGLKSFLDGGSIKRSGAASFLGASLKAGTLDLVGAGAQILETLNPFTTSDAELATLYKNDPAGLAKARDSAANILSSTARAMSSGSAEAMQDISPEAKKAYGALEYATTDSSKAAYFSPVKVLGDVVRSLPTSVALAVSVYMTKGAAKTAYDDAIAAGAAPEVAHQASIAAASKTMANVGAISEGGVGFAQQSNQVVEELSNAAAGAIEKSPRYQQLIAAGYAPEAAKQATIAAVAQEAGTYAGLVDAAVNKVGGAFLGKILTEGGGLGSRVLKGGANEAITEFLQSGGEQLGENFAKQRLLDPNQKLGEGVLESMVQGAVVGFVSGGAFSGMAGAGKTIDQAQQANADAQRIQQLFDLAAGSKLKERDPQSLGAFIQSAADSDGGVPSALYIDAHTLVETLQQAGITPEQFAQTIPAVGTQLKDALASGDTIELPIGELVANLAGSGVETVLLQHLRTSPDALSQAEAKVATQQAQKELSRQADETIAQSAEAEALQASAEAVRTTISEQLTTANRFTKDVNDAYASVVRDFYTVTAQRLGITPEALYQRYPLKVTAASTAKRVETLDQQGQAAPKKIADLSTIVSTEPIKRSKTDQELLDMVHPAGPDDKSIRAVVDGKEVGHLDLAVREDGKLADVREVRVAAKYRRKGVATALYDAARAQGFEVQRSDYQTDEGSAFRDSYDKRSASDVSVGIETPPAPNKYATKFLAGRDVNELSAEARAQYDSLLGEQTLEQSALQTDTPEFKKWFGKSKVVDAAGKPLVVYHGTRNEFSIFDYSRIGDQGRAEGAGFYFTNSKDVASGYGKPMEVYLSINKPLAYEAKPFSKAVVEKIVKRVAEIEAEANGDDVGDGFLSNFGDVSYQGLTTVIRDAAKLIAADQTALDQLSGIVGSGVNPKYVNQATHEVTGHDGVVAKGFSNSGGDSNTIFVAFFPEQIKSATDNNGKFDPNNPSILEQPARGTFSPSQLNITLLQNADLSTFLHELGHFQLEVMADLASQPNAPAPVQQDMADVMKWFGVADLATWRGMTLEQQRPYHEQFARGFEAYLFEGKSPNTAMAGVFQRFRDWLKNVYRSLSALNVTLTDEVRGVFDRLLATDHQIAEAEQSRAYAPLFQDAGATGMTPEEWAAYQRQGADATTTATDELQTRSLKDMRWLTGARSRALKALQTEAKAKRKGVEEEVTAEVQQMPVYGAQRWMKGKGLPDGSPAAGAKLSMPMLKEFYGEGPAAPWRYLATNLVSVDPVLSMAPDDIAHVFGYTSGDALVRDIVNSDREAVMIEGMTDQRMLERYGDLATPEAQARAADEAVHNEARSKFVATELRALQKATNVREKTAAGGTVNVMLRSAKEYAAAVISRKQIKDVKPYVHAASEARAARQAEQALAKGDLVAAATAKRNQLLGNATTREAYAALTDVEKTKEFFRKVMSGKDDVVGKSRDMDVVNAARAVIAQYGIGNARGKTALEYMDLIQKNDPLLYDVLKAPVDAAIINAKPFDTMTVEEMRGLRDEIQAMWHLAKRTREMVVGGELIDRQVAADALLERMNEIGVPDSMPGDTSAVTPAQKRLAMLRTATASAVRVESWAGAKDGAAPIGPFRKYIWQVVKEAANAYRADKVVYLKKYRALLEDMQPLLKRELIEAPEIGYTFGKGQGGVGMSELLHALLHTGNDSNKRKLLVGRKWASLDADGNMDTRRWDTFVARMVTEGKITKQSYDFVQAVWDMLEETKPLAQKAHRDVFGKYFAEVTADNFDTPFGAYRGGYAPAIADPEIVQDASIRALAEAENENMAFAFPGTNKGFTKGRVEYNRPLKLDLRSIGQHLDKVLLFSHMEQPVRDVRKLLSAKGVSYALGRVDPVAIGSILTPWLNRSARQQVESPIIGDGGAMRWFSTMRNNAGMAAMFANTANAAQQIAGFSLAAVKVHPKYLLGAVAEYTKAPRDTAKTVAEASLYMANRMDNEVSAMNGAINDILLDASLYDKGKQWMQRHAYFMQSAVDNVMGPIIWIGARNQALEQGISEADAIRLADSAVRETQGTTQPEDVSRIETGNAFVRVFTQFVSYFNMQANLLGGEFAKIQHAGGLKKGAGRGLYVMTFGFLVNAWAAEAIMQAFKGGPDDENKDGDYLDDWLKQVFGMSLVRNVAAMIPVAGQVVMGAINAGNSKPYDDRIATSPAVSMIESTVKAPYSLYKAITDQGKQQKAVRDVATAISMVTGVPATGVARPVGYLAGVEAGDIQPTSKADAVRGAVTGAASPESKH